jgi:hypothetical protein
MHLPEVEAIMLTARWIAMPFHNLRRVRRLLETWIGLQSYQDQTHHREKAWRRESSDRLAPSVIVTARVTSGA